MAGYEKYTYDCESDARFYMNDGGEIQHQIVPVGKLGYPDGALRGLISFVHQIDGVTYNLSAQAGIGSYVETNEWVFTIDLFRELEDVRSRDSASADFDLKSLPAKVGLRLSDDVALPNGGWVNFTLRCKLANP